MKYSSLVRVKITFPRGQKVIKYFPLRPTAARESIFDPFWPLGKVIFTLTRDEYFILTRPLGEVYHIRIHDSLTSDTLCSHMAGL